MKSPLALDKENVKKYKFPEEVELSPQQKLTFLQNQLAEMKTVHWRARVDMLHAARLQESDVERLSEMGLRNMGEHRNEAEQMAGGIVMTRQYIEELRKEYPELQPEA